MRSLEWTGNPHLHGPPAGPGRLTGGAVPADPPPSGSMTWLALLLAVSLVLAAFAAGARPHSLSVSGSGCAPSPRTATTGRRVVHLHNNPNGYLSTYLFDQHRRRDRGSDGDRPDRRRPHPRLAEALTTVAPGRLRPRLLRDRPKSLALRFNERLALRLAAHGAVLTGCCALRRA